DAGPAPDGTDENPEGPAGRPRTETRGYHGVGRPAGALQPVGGGTALDQGNRHQPAAGIAGAALGTGCPRGGTWSGNDGRPTARSCHPPLSNPPRRRVDDDGREAGDYPADPSRGRTGDDRIPQETIGEKRVPAVLPALEADPTDRP